jgi:hypothetical protein
MTIREVKKSRQLFKRPHHINWMLHIHNKLMNGYYFESHGNIVKYYFRDEDAIATDWQIKL